MKKINILFSLVFLCSNLLGQILTSDNSVENLSYSYYKLALFGKQIVKLDNSSFLYQSYDYDFNNATISNYDISNKLNYKINLKLSNGYLPKFEYYNDQIIVVQSKFFEDKIIHYGEKYSAVTGKLIQDSLFLSDYLYDLYGAGIYFSENKEYFIICKAGNKSPKKKPFIIEIFSSDKLNLLSEIRFKLIKNEDFICLCVSNNGMLLIVTTIEDKINFKIYNRDGTLKKNIVKYEKSVVRDYIIEALYTQQNLTKGRIAFLSEMNKKSSYIDVWEIDYDTVQVKNLISFPLSKEFRTKTISKNLYSGYLPNSKKSLTEKMDGKIKIKRVKLTYFTSNLKKTLIGLEDLYYGENHGEFGQDSYFSWDFCLINFDNKGDFNWSFTVDKYGRSLTEGKDRNIYIPYYHGIKSSVFENSSYIDVVDCEIGKRAYFLVHRKVDIETGKLLNVRLLHDQYNISTHVNYIEKLGNDHFVFLKLRAPLKNDRRQIGTTLEIVNTKD